MTQHRLSVLHFPAALPLLLVFPLLRVTNAGLRFDVIEPGVFHTLAAGPDVLASDRAGVAADALVKVDHHADLCLYFHGLSLFSNWFSGIGLPLDMVETAQQHKLVAVRADRTIICGELSNQVQSY